MGLKRRMGPKHSKPVEDPPADSSSHEKVEDEEPKTKRNSLPRKPETATLVDQSNESAPEAPTIKPIATKPMHESSNVRRTRSKQACSVKQPSESEREAKRPKKKAGEEGTAAVEEVNKTVDDAKKQFFQRLFSEDDEIAVLKGMLEYSDKKGTDPCADMNAFYDFVKKMIHIDVTKAQLMDNIMNLKKKFENIAGKGKRGEDRIFSNPHEQKAFDLSKQVWGNEGITVKLKSSPALSNASKSNRKPKGNGKALLGAVKTEMLSSPEKKVKMERVKTELMSSPEKKVKVERVKTELTSSPEKKVKVERVKTELTSSPKKKVKVERVKTELLSSSEKKVKVEHLKTELLSPPEKKVKAEHEEPKKVENEEEEVKSCGRFFGKRFGAGSLEEELLKNEVDMIGEEKRAGLEKKWRKLKIAEMELFLERSQMIAEHAKLLLEIYKSEDI